MVMMMMTVMMVAFDGDDGDDDGDDDGHVVRTSVLSGWPAKTCCDESITLWRSPAIKGGRGTIVFVWGGGGASATLASTVLPPLLRRKSSSHL